MLFSFYISQKNTEMFDLYLRKEYRKPTFEKNHARNCNIKMIQISVSRILMSFHLNCIFYKKYFFFY